jgi:peroxygenase
MLGTATYLMLWPEDGRMMKVCAFTKKNLLLEFSYLLTLPKEDIRTVYDGSIFHRIAEKRERRLQQEREQRMKQKGQ